MLQPPKQLDYSSVLPHLVSLALKAVDFGVFILQKLTSCPS
jgi:hypothetical protein